MKMLRFAVAAAALCATPAFASTTDMVSGRRADYFAAGRHQFYAWCANGQDRILHQVGGSAAQAQGRLAPAAPGCVLRWQGRAAL